RSAKWSRPCGSLAGPLIIDLLTSFVTNNIIPQAVWLIIMRDIPPREPGAIQRRLRCVSGIPCRSTCSTVVILHDAGLNYAELFRLIETPADLLAKQPANSYRPRCASL